MTVGELISQLSNYHDSTTVLVDGYEDGYDEPGIRLLRVARAKHQSWWSGTWEEDSQGVEVLVIQRTKPEEGR